MIIVAAFIRHSVVIANTVDKGSAAVFANPAANSPQGKKKPSDIMLEKALEKFVGAVYITPQQKESGIHHEGRSCSPSHNRRKGQRHDSS